MIPLLDQSGTTGWGRFKLTINYISSFCEILRNMMSFYVFTHMGNNIAYEILSFSVVKTSETGLPRNLPRAEANETSRLINTLNYVTNLFLMS